MNDLLTKLTRGWRPYVLAALLVTFAFWVWPTPWRYFNARGENIRINRFTGHAEHLYGVGWR